METVSAAKAHVDTNCQCASSQFPPSPSPTSSGTFSSATWHISSRSFSFTSTNSRIGNSTTQVKQNFHYAPPSVRFSSVARIGRVNAKNRHTLNPAHKPTQGEQKIAVTRRCADHTQTPVRAGLMNPIEGHCPPAPEPLPPPIAVARAPGRFSAAAMIRRGDPESSAPNCLR